MKRSIPTTLFQSLIFWVASVLVIIHAIFSYPSLSMPLVAQAAEQAEQSQPTESSSEAKPANTDKTDSSEATAPDAEQQTASDSEESAGPYDMEAIKAFNRALYGS